MSSQITTDPLPASSDDLVTKLTRRPSFAFLRRSSFHDRLSEARARRSTSGSSSTSTKPTTRKGPRKASSTSKEATPRLPSYQTLPDISTTFPLSPQPNTNNNLSDSNPNGLSPAALNRIGINPNAYHARHAMDKQKTAVHAVATPSNVISPPKLAVDPYAKASSMTNRGRYGNYMGSPQSVIDGSRRVRRKKDPTPFK